MSQTETLYLEKKDKQVYQVKPRMLYRVRGGMVLSITLHNDVEYDITDSKTSGVSLSLPGSDHFGHLHIDFKSQVRSIQSRYRSVTRTKKVFLLQDFMKMEELRMTKLTFWN